MGSTTALGGLTRTRVLPWFGARVCLFQAGMVAAAVVLPALAHMGGAQVRWLLPMHWPVILAGLVYGWRGGLIVGLLAPATNWLLTGYPLPLILPAMTVELGVYGFVTGWLRERANWPSFLAVAVALITGRVVFIGTILLINAYGEAFTAYLIAAMVPGLIMAALQVVVLPFIAIWWITSRSEHNWSKS